MSEKIIKFETEISPIIAKQFGPKCFGGTEDQNLGFNDEKLVSEDCLSLNIWRTANSIDAPEGLPVLVFIHGGAYFMGTGSDPRLNGELLALEQEVVVVTINYRLGPWGFYYNPDLLTDQSASSNFGLLDQIEALKWVSKFIKYFRGNPDNITLGGCSAGSQSIMAHMVQSTDELLFHKALLLSPPTGIEYYTAEEALYIYENVATRLNCDRYYSDLGWFYSPSPPGGAKLK